MEELATEGVVIISSIKVEDALLKRSQVRPRNMLRALVSLVLLLAGWASAQELPPDDAVLINEFYRLAGQIQDKLWPGWSKVPTPMLLVTPATEFLTHSPVDPPQEFTQIGEGLYARPRQFDVNLLATFPPFGPPAAIVIGEPSNTNAHTSTPWLIVLMHEHFHQLQYAHPGYYDAVQKLGLSRGDQGGNWMLNYPFPYGQPEVTQSFAHLRDLLLATLSESGPRKFRGRAAAYLHERERVMSRLAPDDRKYLSFQLWQEGIARYMQIKAAEAARRYKPTRAYTALADYQSFADYASKPRTNTLNELREADMATMKRDFFYSFGACEALLLDRLRPGWKSQYFQHLLTTDPLFDVQ